MTTFEDTMLEQKAWRDEMISRVKKIVPAVKERAANAEVLRRQPDETTRELVEAGLLRLLLPKRWGGYECTFDLFVDTVLEVAHVDASAGWCYAFLVAQPWFLALFQDQAQRDVWATNPDATFAGAAFPAGRFTPVPGGYLLNGNWPWVSGVDASQWIMVMALPQEADGPPQLFLLPRSDCKVLDTWFVAGLKASGSKNVMLENAFVPSHRSVSFPAIWAGKAPGTHVNRGPIYQLPMIAAFPIGLVAPILGATKGAYEVWNEENKSKMTGLTRERVAQMTHRQIRQAEIASEIDVAELLLRTCLDTIREGGPLTTETLVRLRRDYAVIARKCVNAVEQMYLYSGGSVNYETHPLQRYWRDIHAMAAHAALNIDTVSESFGRFQLGLPSNPNDNMRF